MPTIFLPCIMRFVGVSVRQVYLQGEYLTQLHLGIIILRLEYHDAMVYSGDLSKNRRVMRRIL